MSQPSFRALRRAIMFVPRSPLVLLLAAACGESAPVAPRPLPPLVAATWHVHRAEGQALPALVAHRLEEGVLVQDFLDSARVEVREDGRWVRRLWMSRFRDQAYDAPMAGQEAGSWAVTDSGYLFTAEPGGRRFVVAAMAPGRDVTLPIRGGTEGMILATLRTAPPAPSVIGSYLASTVRGIPVPAPIYVFNDYQENGRVMSIHFVVDSSRLTLLANGTYAHAIHYAEWEGPNHGPPTALRYRAQLDDHGSVVRDGARIEFVSAWLQNLRFGGTVAGGTALELVHGLSREDEQVPIRYLRR